LHWDIEIGCDTLVEVELALRGMELGYATFRLVEVYKVDLESFESV
jgi:hypothetical protein